MFLLMMITVLDEVNTALTKRVHQGDGYMCSQIWKEFVVMNDHTTKNGDAQKVNVECDHQKRDDAFTFRE